MPEINNEQFDKDALIKKYKEKIARMEAQLAEETDEDKIDELKVEIYYDKWWIEKIVTQNHEQKYKL